MKGVRLCRYRLANWVALGLALCGLSAAAIAAPTTCGQRFDAAVQSSGPAATDGVSIEPIGCASAPNSPRHCFGIKPEGNQLLVAGPAAGTPVHKYQLWLHVATSAASGTLGLKWNSNAVVRWWVPPTRKFGWQLVTLPDKKTPQRFLVHHGENRLRLELPRRTGTTAAIQVDCLLFAADPDFIPDIRAVHRLDRVWAGVGVLFDAIADRRFLYVGYFNAERHLTIAVFDRQRRVWQRKPLPDLFGGWDNHNAIALALDMAGNIHIAGDMHASPLVYGHSTHPGSLDGLDLSNRMVGRDEDRTTYPTFLDLPGGRLGFMYREGVSGAGRHVVDVYDGARWSRLGSAALFAVGHGASASAYPTTPRLGPDGYFHLAWVWRHTADAGTNYQVAYAKTRDFQHWLTYDGRPVELPISPGRGDIIDDVKQGAGLWNELALGFDGQGRPIVSYLKYGSSGNTQLFDARPDHGGWQITQVSDWHSRWEPKGYGTMRALIHQSAVTVDSGLLTQEVRHWKEGRFDYILDPVSLRPVAVQPPARLLPMALVQATMPAPGFFPIVIAARQVDQEPTKFVLRWDAQASDRDHRPACTTARPLACDPPPSQLTIFERQ